MRDSEPFLQGMEECNYATSEASFEAKACDESRTGVRGRRVDFFTSGGCIGSGRADTGPAADAELLHRVTQSRSVKRKSPTSAWRRSMSSTRRTPQRPRRRTGSARLRWLPRLQGLPRLQRLQRLRRRLRMAAAAAEAAACRGELAASARPDRFPITLTNAGHHGRVRQVDPANPCLLCSAARVRRRAHDGRVDLNMSRNASARAGRGNSSGRRIRLAPANRRAGQGARADVMTGDRRTSSTRQAGKDIPQFAPNFTVYVLPPDVVCLYSEDRKFFLHGELYCALASAIGKGRKEPSGSSFANSGRIFRPTRSRKPSSG